MRQSTFWAAVTAVGLGCAAFGAAPVWQPVSELKVPAGQKLRGFGPCDVTFGTYRSEAGQVAVIRFQAANAEAADLVAGKFLGDLQDSFEVKRENLKVGGAEVPLFLTAGGQAFAVTRNGTETMIYGAVDRGILAAYFESKPEAAAGAVATGTYPEYMKRFAWGVYGVGGLENHHEWMAFDGNRDDVKDPVEDLQFLKEMNMHFDNWLDYAGFDSSDGILANSGRRWKTKYAREHQIPYAHRVYVNAGGSDWTARRFPEYMEQPAWFLQSGWHGLEMFWKANPHLSWYATDLQNYLARLTQKMMIKHQTPETRGWMHPHGELTHDDWYDMHSDYSRWARESWINYLKKHGVTLAEASEMYRRGNSPFQTYEQIPIPEFATFAGLPGEIVPLQGEWLYRRELDRSPADEAWWKQDYAERYPGVKEKWYAPDADLSEWQPIKMPGDEKMYSLYPNGRREHTSTIWFRRNFNYSPELAQGKPVYLYFFPVSFDGIHSAGIQKRYHQLYLNGEKIGEVGCWGALDVTKALKNGSNDLAIQLHGGVWNGRIFLSTEPPRVFPYLGAAQNKLWELWSAWRTDAKFDSWANILDAMRQVDPDKPIKFMAPQGFGSEKWLRLAYNYGGWPHFTGEGMWYYPWYKRYAKLYGVPATSELAGPSATVEQQADGFRRTFLAGLDGHEPVFMIQTYSRNPEIRKWWQDRRDVLHRMGKYDIAGPQVLIYRSTWNTLNNPLTPYPEVGTSARMINSPWNWDIGRGTLQTLGQSMLYLDDCGVTDGKMYGYPLIFDCGNETMEPQVVAELKNYVEQGGVFVTLPFTGRNTRTAPDSWPISELTGCKVIRTRPLGGKVTFAPDQTLFRAHAGKTFDDNGKSLDWMTNNLNTYSVELEPGKDCTVLATYENGKPAIVARKLGKGLVITLGSAFWRDAADVQGLWWPGESETAFVADLLAGAGFPQALCESNDRLIWPQPYRSNNGLDFVTVLVNWNEKGVQKPTITLRLPQKPAKIVSYAVGGVKEQPFTWKDGVATLQVELPAREVMVLAAEVFEPESAVAHWWSRQQELWHQLVPSTRDFSVYDSGKWAEPTLDLSDDACFTNTAPEGDWTAVKFDDSAWTPAPLDVLNFWGAKENTPVWVRKHFTVDPAWLQSGMTRLISGAWSGPQYLNPTRMVLNGKELHGFTKNNFNEFDVTRLLQPGDNVLAYEIKNGEKYTGIVGNVYLNHRQAPEESLSLNGVWEGSDGKGNPAALTIPGSGRVMHPAKSVFIPESWKGKYRIRFYEVGAPYSVLGVWVNGSLVRRHHHHLGRYCDIDITDALKFGAENRLELAFGTEYNGRALKEVHNFEIEEVRLDLFPAE